MAACRERNIIPYNMCLYYYTADVYHASFTVSIYPILDRLQCYAPKEVSSRIILSPRDACRQVGRSRTKHILSLGEDIILRRYSKCRGIGHNRRNCTNYFSYTSNETSRSYT